MGSLRSKLRKVGIWQESCHFVLTSSPAFSYSSVGEAGCAKPSSETLSYLHFWYLRIFKLYPVDERPKPSTRPMSGWFALSSLMFLVWALRLKIFGISERNYTRSSSQRVELDVSTLHFPFSPLPVRPKQLTSLCEPRNLADCVKRMRRKLEVPIGNDLFRNSKSVIISETKRLCKI